MVVFDIKGDINNDLFENIKLFFSTIKPYEDVQINISSLGGYVNSGEDIYDFLRMQPNHTIYTNAVGDCSSAAILVLLAAKPENRTANPNVRSLIHQVSTPIAVDSLSVDYITTNDADRLASDMHRVEDRIVNIYSEQTGRSKIEMHELLKREMTLNADELLSYGFINKINKYINRNMKKLNFKAIGQALINLDAKINADETDEASLTQEIKNENGEVVLLIPDGEKLAIGVEATLPDGTKDGEADIDGVIVKIESGLVTDIKEPKNKAPKEDDSTDSCENADDEPKDDDKIAELQKEVDELKAQIDKLLKKSGEQVDEILNLKSKVSSNFKAPERHLSNKKAPASYDEKKEDLITKMNKLKK